MKNKQKVSPPILAINLLLLSLGSSDDARSVVGDLSEDFETMAEQRGYWRAWFWFWREALLLSLTLRHVYGRGGRQEKGTRFDLVEARHLLGGFLAPAALVQDGRQAFRAVRKDLRMFFFSVAILGFGMGICGAVFTVIHPLLISDLPFPNSDRLVWIAKSHEGGMSDVTSRVINLRDFRSHSESFEGLSGFNAFFEERSYTLTSDTEPIHLVGVDVVSDLLDVLGVEPLLGRSFTKEEGEQGGPKSIILTHGFWRRHFGSDPSVVGRSIAINGHSNLVIGVLPESFGFASIFSPRTRIDFLRAFPVSIQTDQQEGNTLTMIGRLKPGLAPPDAQADLDRVVALLASEDPNRWGLDAAVSGMQEKIARPYRSALLLLVAAATAVMLIVCVNLSNLLLAKRRKRSSEMAVRSALGAPRLRLVRQLQLESLIFALGGAALALPIASAATAWVGRTTGLSIPMLAEAQIGPHTVGFVVLLTVLTGLLMGLLPAFSFTHKGASDLRQYRRSLSSGREGVRMREALVVAEIAISCMLLVFAGLLLKSFHKVVEVDLGFQPSGLVAWQISSARPFETITEQAVFFDQVAQKVATVPGVSSVGMVDAVPLGNNRMWMIGAPGHEYDGFWAFPAFPHLVDRNYLRTMEISITAGRSFTATDHENSQGVVILNETAAERVFHGEPALGRKVMAAGQESEVIGIVSDIRHRSLEQEAGAQMYFPISQAGNFNRLDLVVRSTLPADSLARDVAAAIHAVDPSIPALDYRPLTGLVDRSLSPRRFVLQLLLAFAAGAAVLAALGVYGVLSCSIADRRAELGIRMALGETRGGVMKRVVTETFVLAGIGWVLGAAASLPASRFVASLLFQVEPTDPWTFVAIAGLLTAVALIAGSGPAWKASRTNVASVLRSG